MTDSELDRREFLRSAALGTCALSSLLATAPATGQEAARTGPPPDQPLTPTTPHANMGSLYPLISQLAGESKYPLSFTQPKLTSLDEFKAAGRAKVLECFGYRPPPEPPRAEVIARQELPEFTREKILFSTSPHFRVPAYLHIPKGLKQPAPAIVDLHSHGGMFMFGKEKVIDFGANHPTMTTYHERNYGGRPTATELAKRGYVVITIDAFMFGERRYRDGSERSNWDRAKLSTEDIDVLNRQCRGKESTIAKSLIYAGMCWPGIITWDDIRTVDYLVTRPEVDPRRIGCVGVSLGGWRSLFLAGLDERIAAACVVGFMSTVQPMLERHIDTHSFAHFVPGLHQWLDLPDVVSMQAPKPLLVQQCKQDGLFPLAGMEASVEKIAAVYAKAGAKDRFSGRFYDVPHRFDVAMQEEAFAWFDQQLKR